MGLRRASTCNAFQDAGPGARLPEARGEDCFAFARAADLTPRSANRWPEMAVQA
jgi:hypothetical protein